MPKNRMRTQVSLITTRARLRWKTGDNQRAMLDLPWEAVEAYVPEGHDECTAGLTLWDAGKYADVEMYADELDGVINYSFNKIENIGDNP